VVLCGNCLPTFRDNVKMGPIHCPETSVNNYHMTLRNIPEERESHQHCDESLKSRFCKCVWLLCVCVSGDQCADFVLHSCN
jgi:hypothetical protein